MAAALGNTYRASRSGVAVVVVATTAKLAVGVLAGTAHGSVGSLNLNGEVELLGSGRVVLEDGQPSSTVAVTNTNVDWCKVAPWVAAGTPLATIFGGYAGGVDIVLSRGG